MCWKGDLALFEFWACVPIEKMAISFSGLREVYYYHIKCNQRNGNSHKAPQISLPGSITTQTQQIKILKNEHVWMQLKGTRSNVI